MNGTNFLRNLREYAAMNFVFITYSHANSDIKERVIKLGTFLLSQGINVIFDGGAMPGGANNAELMNMIVHNNCRHILMVCDSSYIHKVTSHTGGVDTEAQLLLHKINTSSDRTLATSNIIPLIAEKVDIPASLVPYFADAATYLLFLDDTAQTFQKILEAVKDCTVTLPPVPSPSNSVLKKKAAKAYQKADEAYNTEQYEAAEQAIEVALETYQSVSQKNHRVLEEYCHLASIIYLRTGKNLLAQSMCEQAIRLEKKRHASDYQKLALYYANLSLASRNNITAWETYAETALGFAQKGGSPDIHYYYSLYSSALFFAHKYKDAYKYALKEYNFLAAQNCLESKDGIKCICNLAEMSVHLLSDKRRSDNLSRLKEAQEYILQAIHLVKQQNDFNDSEYHELYRIAGIIFGAMQKYYSK